MRDARDLWFDAPTFVLHVVRDIVGFALALLFNSASGINASLAFLSGCSTTNEDTGLVFGGFPSLQTNAESVFGGVEVVGGTAIEAISLEVRVRKGLEHSFEHQNAKQALGSCSMGPEISTGANCTGWARSAVHVAQRQQANASIFKDAFIARKQQMSICIQVCSN